MFLFIVLISAEYLRSLTTGVFVGTDNRNHLIAVPEDLATRLSKRSIYASDQSPDLKIVKEGSWLGISAYKSHIKLSRWASRLRVILNADGGFQIKNIRNYCLGFKKGSRVMMLTNCYDKNADNLFVFMNSITGYKGDVKFKYKNCRLNVYPIVQFGTHFSWKDIKDHEVKSLLLPYVNPQKEHHHHHHHYGSCDIVREFAKLNEF